MCERLWDCEGSHKTGEAKAIIGVFPLFPAVCVMTRESIEHL